MKTFYKKKKYAVTINYQKRCSQKCKIYIYRWSTLIHTNLFIFACWNEFVFCIINFYISDESSELGIPNENSDITIQKKSLPDLDKYWKAVNDDPSDFTAWTYLLQYVEQEVHFII